MNKYEAILRWGYTEKTIYTRFTAENDFEAFEKLLEEYSTGVYEEDRKDESTFEDLVNLYEKCFSIDGGYDEILLLLKEGEPIYHGDNVSVCIKEKNNE